VSREVIKVEGLQELDRALVEVGEAIGPRKARTVLRQGMQDVLKPMAAEAKARVRVDKGTLRDSIKVGGTLNRSQRRSYRKQSDIEVHMGPSGLPQATTEEFGTSDQSPHPYMRPTWDAGKGEALEKFKAFLWARIEKARKRFAKTRA